ncbi:MAG: hypothetical protein PGN23_16360 [Sphingomonas adhaesiva]|uniref:hypothetical protein n=1 Tax=Sphingomonas adhaesiva TaxID=28212 RepID=UPI002FF53601
MAQMQLPEVWREVAWGLLGLGFTALAFHGAAWSYPQGYETIWAIGGLTLAAVAILSGREVMRVHAASPADTKDIHHG